MNMAAQDKLSGEGRREFLPSDFSAEAHAEVGLVDGCICRAKVGHRDKQWNSGGVTQVPVLARVPTMGCPIHDVRAKASDPVHGTEYEADDMPSVDREIEHFDIADKTDVAAVRVMIHGKLGDPAPGHLFDAFLLPGDSNTAVVTGFGHAMCGDLPTMRALHRATGFAAQMLLDKKIDRQLGVGGRAGS